MDQAKNPVDAYRYAPSSIQSKTFQGCFNELPVSGQSSHICLCINETVHAFALAFMCVSHVQSEGMQTHLSEDKKTLFMLHTESLSSWGLKANAPKHVASIWYFLPVWTLTDSLQNVTVRWPTVNVWKGMRERKLIYISSPNTSSHWQECAAY